MLQGVVLQSSQKQPQVDKGISQRYVAVCLLLMKSPTMRVTGCLWSFQRNSLSKQVVHLEREWEKQYYHHNLETFKVAGSWRKWLCSKNATFHKPNTRGSVIPKEEPGIGCTGRGKNSQDLWCNRRTSNTGLAGLRLHIFNFLKGISVSLFRYILLVAISTNFNMVEKNIATLVMWVTFIYLNSQLIMIKYEF